MHFSFIKELFPKFDVNILTENGIETVYIKNKQFADTIIIHYFPDDYYIYLLKFATSHRDISSQNELIECVQSFVSGKKATIEFFENEKNKFGGEIDASFLDDLTYNKLRNYFGYPNIDISNLTFKVRAWNNQYCFDGCFHKNDYGTIDIVKNIIVPSTAKCTP